MDQQLAVALGHCGIQQQDRLAASLVPTECKVHVERLTPACVYHAYMMCARDSHVWEPPERTHCMELLPGKPATTFAKHLQDSLCRLVWK